MKKLITSIAAVILLPFTVQANGEGSTIQPEVLPYSSVIAEAVANVLHEECHVTFSEATLRDTKDHSVMYAMLVALDNLSPDGLPVYLKAMKNTVDCDDEELWSENFIAYLKVESNWERIE